MHTFTRNTALAGLMGATLLIMGGCATQEEVQKAQTTADQAVQAAAAAQQSANGAQQQAQAAMSAAQAAQQSANQAHTDISTLDTKVQGQQQDIDNLKPKRRRGQRG